MIAMMEPIAGEDLPPIRSAANRVRIAGLIAVSLLVYAVAWMSTSLVFLAIAILVFGVPAIFGSPTSQYFIIVSATFLPAAGMLVGLAFVPTRRWSFVRRLHRETASAAKGMQPNHQVDNLVAGLAIAAGIRVPRVVILNERAPNAYAVGTRQRNTTIGFTVGIIDALSRSELEAVVAWQVVRIASGELALTTWATALATDAVRELDVVGSSDPLSPVAFGAFGRVVTWIPRRIAASYEAAVLRRVAKVRDRLSVLYTHNPRALLDAFEILQANHADIGCASRATAPLWIEVPLRPFRGSVSDYRLGLSLDLTDRIAALRKIAGVPDPQ